MEIKFNVKGNERKELVSAISEIIGEKSKYKGMPSAAYEIAYITVDKAGTLSLEDSTHSKEIENILKQLEEKGFIAQPQEQTEDTKIEAKTKRTEYTDPEKQMHITQDETFGLTVAMPKDYFTGNSLLNMENLLEAKGNLIKKALGIDNLPIEIDEEKVLFPWFSITPPDRDTVNAYTHLIYSLCEMARNQKRIQSKEKEVENEKYAFRCMLLRLGFIGEAYKVQRKILLKNFTGSSAFKGGSKNEVSE